MNDHLQNLAAELGGSLPAGFDELPVERLEWLVDKVREVKAETAESLEKSTTDSVNNLPVMLRSPARAILGASK